MKRCSLLLVAAVIVASCATSKSAASNPNPKPKIPEPEIGVEQVVGPADLGYPYGPIEVKYNLAVQNNASETITLIRVNIQSINPSGGAYSLRRDFYNFKQPITPNSIGVV